MKSIGEITAIVELNDKNIETKFVVIDSKYDSKSIIGLQVLIKFKLIKNVSAIRNIDNELQKNKFVKQNRDTFEGVGCFPDVCSLNL